MIAGGERQRLATLLWYISTPEKGGETQFPRVSTRHVDLLYLHSQHESNLILQTGLRCAQEGNTF